MLENVVAVTSFSHPRWRCCPVLYRLKFSQTQIFKWLIKTTGLLYYVYIFSLSQQSSLGFIFHIFVLCPYKSFLLAKAFCVQSLKSEKHTSGIRIPLLAIALFRTPRTYYERTRILGNLRPKGLSGKALAWHMWGSQFHPQHHTDTKKCKTRAGDVAQW